MCSSKVPYGDPSTLAALLRPLAGRRHTLQRPDGSRLNVVEAGDGDEAALLVHGFGVSSDSWSLVQPKLVARGFRVLAYDQRGHGRSTIGHDGIGSAQLVEDLRVLITEFDLQDAVMACHSMGNFVGLSALRDAAVRKRFARAVLVNPITGNALRGAPLVRFEGPLVRVGVAQRLARSRAIGGALARASLGPSPRPAVVEATRLCLVAHPQAVGPCITMLQKESVELLLPQIDLPLHVLASTTDRTTPSWHAELIVARAPRAKIDYVADAGHMLPFEAPEAIISAISNEK